jgi:hypothetical protein
VEGERPESEYVVPVTVAISEKTKQPAPWQRSIRYWTTPTSSVAALQDRPTWVGLDAVAVRPVGAVGGWVSDGAGVVAEAVVEYGPRLRAASWARTRYE